MDAVKTEIAEVERAVAGIKRAVAKLINLLKSSDESVRAGASVALLSLDPPPVLDMITTLFKSRDTNFKVEIIKVLSGLDEEFRAPVSLALSQVWQVGDPAVRRAIIDAVMVMGPAPVEASPTPVGAAPTQDDTPRGRPRNRTSPQQ